MVTITPKKIQYVIGSKGKPTGVLVDLKTWEAILEALEEADDIALAREALAKLDAAGGISEKAGFIPWGKARIDLESQDAKK
jgi:PHD/YefM family antitoxin component YafN of YafNO toxin-antitoxin module